MDNLYVGKEARIKLLAGVNKVVDAVKLTLGARGSNALIQVADYPYTINTSDGISIIEAIKLTDPIEKMGADLVKENSGRHNRQSGDGSTSAAILLQAILHEANKITDVAPIEIMDSLNEALPKILQSIEDQTKPVTVDEVGKVATIAARDEKIGALIQEIYQQIGKDGILYPDISKTFEDHYTLGKGVKIEGAGFASPYMADMDESGRFLNVSTCKNPHILITKQKITTAMEVNDLVAALYAKEIKELVIFCDEIEAAVIPDLILTRAKRGFKTLVIKLPVFWKDNWFEDLAKMTGATVIDPSSGISFKTMKLEHLGKCENLSTDKNDTYLDGILDLTEWCKTIDDDSDEAKIRVARLNTKTARLFVGAHSDAMLSYRRLRVEDARNSAYLALQNGVVAGGGICLLNAAKSLRNPQNLALSIDLETKKENRPNFVGLKILEKALQAPFKQICLNAGITVQHQLTDEEFENPPQNIDSMSIEGNKGFNAKTGEIVDMFDAGILDSASVVKNSIRNALSVASIVLTCPIIIPLQEEKQVAIPQGMPRM